MTKEIGYRQKKSNLHKKEAAQLKLYGFFAIQNMTLIISGL